MGDRSVIDPRTLGGTKGSEFIRVEVLSVVHDDIVWHTISEYQLSDETHGSTCFKVFNRLGFDPLGKLVECYQHVGKSAPAGPQRSNHVQSPNSKRPDKWDSL